MVDWSQFSEKPPGPDWSQFSETPPVAPTPQAQLPEGKAFQADGKLHVVGAPQNWAISAILPNTQSPEDIADAATQNRIAMQAMETRYGQHKDGGDFISKNAGRTYGMAQGILPFADRILPAIVAGQNTLFNGGNLKGNYMLAQDIMRQETDQHARDAPIEHFGAEAMGGGLTALAGNTAGASTVARAAENVGARFPVLSRFLGSAGEGAGYGFAQGASANRDGGMAQFKDALKGSGIGALFGGAAMPVGEMLGGLARGAQGIVRSYLNPAQRGEDVLLRSMQRDATSPNALADAMVQAQGAGVPYVAADAGGRNLAGILKNASRTPSDFRSTVGPFVAGRQAGQAGRVVQNINDLMGVNGQDAFMTGENLAAARRTQSLPLYAQADNMPTPQGPAYDALLQRGSVQNAIPNLNRIASEQAVPTSVMFDNIPTPLAQQRTTVTPTGILDQYGNPVTRSVVDNPTMEVPSARGWNNIYRTQADATDQAFRGGEGTLGTAMGDTRTTLRNQLRQDNPAFAAANDVYSSHTDTLNALGLGQQLGPAANPDALLHAYGQLTPGDQRMAQLGFARSLQEAPQRAGPQVNNVPGLQSLNMGAKLDGMGVPQARQAAFNENLGREANVSRTNRAIVGGSDTAENLIERADTMRDLPDILSQLISTTPWRAAPTIARAGLRFVQGQGEGVANVVGPLLTNSDPQAVRNLQAAFERLRPSTNAPVSVIQGALNANPRVQSPLTTLQQLFAPQQPQGAQ